MIFRELKTWLRPSVTCIFFRLSPRQVYTHATFQLAAARSNYYSLEAHLLLLLMAFAFNDWLLLLADLPCEAFSN